VTDARDTLERYVRALEAARTERGHAAGVLPPGEWRRLERWFHAGVPLGWIYECLDEATGDPRFSARRCWASLERRVLEGWEVFAGHPPRDP